MATNHTSRKHQDVVRELRKELRETVDRLDIERNLRKHAENLVILAALSAKVTNAQLAAAKFICLALFAGILILSSVIAYFTW